MKTIVVIGVVILATNLVSFGFGRWQGRIEGFREWVIKHRNRRSL